MSSRPLLLVTGGSRGIGAAICRKAAAQGCDLLVNYRSDKAAAEAVAADCRTLGAGAEIVQGDTATEEGIAAIFAAVDRLGPLFGLVNNAGVVDVTARVEEFDRARLDRMFAVNVIGKIRCATEAVKRMSTKHGGQGGVIVNISSMAAVIGSAGQYVDYAAAKAAVDTFTVGLSREVATEGIRVNAVRPGIIDTEIHASGGLPDRARDLAPVVPMQRPGTADEVADSVLYLLSPQASYVTGALLNVSGGR
ncbi:NAD(P)-dependent dehydrogenase (short-subunit alcohol dehydrogenase family) [Peteryoungia aggregata LMG 23059]|uniref:NAD(P)-dependent dehydrogenase (Short-subunit alcohol dehydrogenase family) n=1 Tax=Peteryoungia aggregata LMG 23059 TaxID=1368425 RepID=A0ABU0G5J5_9HYPH|nr:SDR family oxidoreductase [Peteryoungia aggregata]MDQ0420619.1 NAD(P)-dependent dehydrogenase (short-subunit alcohol dehydrogenase family) [Peteryoungia aggregata LMG 23059]